MGKYRKKFYKRKITYCKKTKAKPNEKTVSNEYELQKQYHSWYSSKFSCISCGTPYSNMGIKARMKAKKKGYLKGYPDYVEHDPRMKLTKDGNLIKLKIIPGKVVEFKSPSGKGHLSKEQSNVLQSLKERGFKTNVVKDLKIAKKKTMKYKNETIPIYNGWITIDLEKKQITYPTGNQEQIKMEEQVRKKNIRKILSS
jgi:hypothetical protein